ncbi:hypothetical protein NVP1189B_61 [Vibrio phage 1.189.B._10N.286.51.B5]|nr:hypothetical protein NVP1189B_61 [Vibrio phage 1.189.B._10N.286.51.B5]AUR93953.1 hypothetical protein NVP1189C_61 [Vibrio phage 1.189.C._10N.286.51.B5]AUR94019.1 hypothetical protein NVP1189O_61 [Vibrio phage 1.189.O._10N.286.51.B5]
MILIRFLLLAIVSVNAHAASIYLGGLSVHLSDPPSHIDEWNNDNYLLALEHNNFIGGAFLNSFEDVTYFGAYKVEALKFEYINVNLLLGVMYGYKEEDNDFLNVNGWQPMIAPQIEFKTPYVRPSILFTGSALTLIVGY